MTSPSESPEMSSADLVSILSADEKEQEEALTLDPVEAHREASWRMKKIRKLLEQRAVVDASYRDQIGEIDVWHQQETGQLDGEVERLKLEMQPYVAALTVHDPRGKKSVNLVAGTAGFREGRERVVVEDQWIATGYILAHYSGLEEEKCVRIKRELDIPTVKRLFPQPDVIPGIRVEKSERSFYVDATGKDVPR